MSVASWRKLVRIWRSQGEYNDKVFLEQEATTGEHLRLQDRHRWTKEYLLGMMSELDEVLREVRWKQHRRQDLPGHARDNMREELADLTKYVFSLWQLWGFSLMDMLRAVEEKGETLSHRWEIEHSSPRPGQIVAIVDLDGTLADWHDGMWPVGMDRREPTTLLADVEFGMSWREY